MTLLESRAGAPAWGPELLIRHQLVGAVDNLASLFAEWERWAADVAESHTSYPSLLFLRSPRAQNSWLVSLVAVMDAAALSVAVEPRGRTHRGTPADQDGVHLPAPHRRGDPHPLRRRPRSPTTPSPYPGRSSWTRLRPTPGARLPRGPDRRRSVAPVPRLAGQLRVGGLRPGRPGRRPAGPLDRAPEHVPRPGTRTGPSGRPAARPRRRRSTATPDRRRLGPRRVAQWRFHEWSTGCSRSQPSSLKAAGSSTRCGPPSGSSPIQRTARTRSTWEWATQATSPEHGPHPGDDPVDPVGHVAGRLAPGRTVGEEVPPRPVLADLGGRHPLVGAVVPLGQVRVDVTSCPARPTRRSPGPGAGGWSGRWRR